MDLTQLIPLLTAAAGPIIGILIGLARLWRGDHQLDDLIRLSELHRQLPSEAQSASLELIQERFHEYAQRRRRKINVGNLGALIFVVVVGGGLTYGLSMLAVQATGAWLWVLGITAVLTGLLTLALSVGGMSILYAPQKTDSKQKS